MNTVLVTAVGSFSAGAAIEYLKKDGCRVVGCDIYPAEWVVNSAFADVFYQAPYATDEEAYREFLRQVCKKEKVDFVMPSTDLEIDVLRGWETAEEEMGAVLCMSGRETLAVCRDKRRLAEFLKPLGVCETIPGRLLSEIWETEEETGYVNLTYPLVVKPVDGRSSQGLRMIETPEAMVEAVKALKEQKGSGEKVRERVYAALSRFLVQPKIAGPVVTVDVVREPVSGETVCVPRRELLRTANGAGLSVCVFSDEKLERQCREIAKALNIRGCVNFEFLETKTPGDEAGEWVFLECNPRFSGGLAFSCLAGYNMVRNHLRCFAGQAIEPAGIIRAGHFARRYTEYAMD